MKNMLLHTGACLDILHLNIKIDNISHLSHDKKLKTTPECFELK